jgi:phage terminase large subunit GpA-like protein
VQAKAAGTEQLKTFVNTVLGETWREAGEVPDYELLQARAGGFEARTVPNGVAFLTCGVDVQKDRLVYEVVGWGKTRESWSIEHGELFGDTGGEEVWVSLDALIDTSYPTESGSTMKIRMTAVDSGYNTQTVYNYCRRYSQTKVIAVKGVHTARTLISSPSKVDVKHNGKKTGYKVWPVGSSVAKGEFYGWLKQAPGDDGTFPRGYCHFPKHETRFFMEITAEQLVPVVNAKGFVVLTWKRLPNRENHLLDCRVYARAAAALVGLDRMRQPGKSEAATDEEPEVTAGDATPPAPSVDLPVVPAPAKRPPRPAQLTTPRKSFWGKR